MKYAPRRQYNIRVIYIDFTHSYRGDWFGSSATIKGGDKDAGWKVSFTMHECYIISIEVFR